MDKDNWDRVTEFLVPKKLRGLLSSKSSERSKTKTRKPHTVPSPFPLIFPHTHQDDDEARRTPAIFLACGKAKDEENIMRIKFDEEGQKGDKKGGVYCFCLNPSRKDPTRQGYFQDFVEGEEFVIPTGEHLVSSRALFLSKDYLDQLQDKDVFLLNI